MGVLKKLNKEVPSEPAVPYLSIDPEKTKIKKTPAPNDHHGGTRYNNQDTEAASVYKDR